MGIPYGCKQIFGAACPCPVILFSFSSDSSPLWLDRCNLLRLLLSCPAIMGASHQSRHFLGFYLLRDANFQRQCNGETPCSRCLKRGVTCEYATSIDHRGTAPKSLIYLLKSRVELLEQILWLHSIDIESSIAELRAGRSISPDDQVDTDAHSTCTESSTQLEEALSLNGSLSFECDGETRYFGTSSGRAELLQYANSEFNV